MAIAKRTPFQIILLRKALFCRVRYADGVAFPHTAHRVAGTAAGSAGEQGQIQLSVSVAVVISSIWVGRKVSTLSTS